MRDAIDFERDVKYGEFLDPRQDFAPNRVESEVRYDPLTGDSGRICHFAFDKAPEFDLGDAVEETKANCPFCPDKVLEITPKFPESLVSEGRMQRGEAVIFPNLFPYDDVSAVGVVSKAHFIEVHRAEDRILVDILVLARDFFERVEATRPAEAPPSYALFTWNYLPPAGGSQLHPHVQVIHTTRPANLIRRRLEAETEWRERHGRPYAESLLEQERNMGDRWVGEHGAAVWHVPYVPAGVMGDCMATFPGKAGFTELSDSDISDFVSGLKSALRFFAERGLTSFNLAFSGDAAGAPPDRHWLNVQIVPRFYVNPAMRSTDAAYLQMLWGEPFAMAYPEETASGLRDAFAED